MRVRVPPKLKQVLSNYPTRRKQVVIKTELREDGEEWKEWCMVYNGLDGDGEFDDVYEPTHWMPLPEPPKPENQ